MTEPWLDTFLRRQFFRAHADGRCTRLQLVHMAGGRAVGVQNWPYPEDAQPQEDDLDTIATDILEAAQSDANGRFGRQRYGIRAYYEKSPTTVAESRSFVRDGGADENEDGSPEEDSEGPTMRGLTTQLMRHNEATMRLAVQSSAQIIRGLESMLATATNRAMQADETRLRAVQIYESLLSEKHVRDLAAEEAKLRAKMLQEGFDGVKLLVPTVVNRLAGRTIVPERASAADEMLGQLMESITPEQVEKLQGALRPEQFLVVVELIQRRKAIEAQREKDQQAASGGNGTS